jgi:hypothetical protein
MKIKIKCYSIWIKIFLIIFIFSVGYYISVSISRRTPLVLPENKSEKLVLLKGKLIVKLVPGPPEYSSIKDGDSEEYCWILKLDKSSFKITLKTPVYEPANSLKNIMKHSKPNQISLCLDVKEKKNCQEYINQDIECEGYLFHAHNIHHRTPILMDVRKIYKNGTLVGQR